MGKKVLQCEYCRHIITETDTKCPNCGANCVNVIKKYKAEQEAEAEKRKNELQNQAQQAAKAVGVGFGAFAIFPVVIFIIILIVTAVAIFGIRNKDTGSKKTVTETINESVKTDNYTITIDEYEFYEYSHDTFRDCNTKDGYQRIAFHFVIENTGENTLTNMSLPYKITAKADSEVLNKSSIHADRSFCNLKQGKKDYNDISGSKILVGDKESGYIGYEVPTNAEKLKFIIDEEHIIEMDNPAYKK